MSGNVVFKTLSSSEY